MCSLVGSFLASLCPSLGGMAAWRMEAHVQGQGELATSTPNTLQLLSHCSLGVSTPQDKGSADKALPKIIDFSMWVPIGSHIGL